MEKLRGWLLDAYVQGPGAVLWLKGEDGSMLRLTDGYTPFFHVEAREGVDEDDLLYRLSDCREVRSARVETRLTSLEHGRPRRLVRVETHGTGGFRDLVASIEGNACVSRVYNAGMRHVQRYLFTRLPIEPSSRVLVSHEGERLMGMERLDDWNELAPPPFSLFYFSPLYSPSEDGAMAVAGVATRFRGERREFASMGGFAEYLREADPDLLSCPKCDRVTYPALRAAFSEGGAPFDLGRCADRDQVRAQGSLAGRVILGNIFYGFDSDEWGIAGLVERTRFSFAPMGLSTRWLSNKSIDSRNCYVLLQRGYAIPKEEFFEEARPLRALSERDRGGITMTPEAGRLHKNVAALDFDSQYPNIILRNNLSYESPSGGDGGLGVLPAVVGPWLERRLHLKKVKRTLAAGTPERLYCEQRVDALKMILVCVTPETKVMLNDSYMSMDDLKSKWNGQKVASVNEHDMNLGESSITKYIALENPKGFETYQLTTESGRSITATADHPFLTPAGWKTLRDLNAGERVAISLARENELNPEPNESNDKMILPEDSLARLIPQNTGRSYILNKLKRLDLIPLSYSNAKLPIIARLCGHIFGDGCLSTHESTKQRLGKQRKRTDLMVCLSGRKGDVERIIKDMQQLGFPVSKGSLQNDRTRRSKIVGVDGISHFIRGMHGTSVVQSNTPLWTLLMALGCPVGEKATKSMLVPQWIMNGTVKVKREFLAAYLGSDGSKIKWGKNCLYPTYFVLAKVAELVNDGVQFANQVSKLLKEFGVKASKVAIHPELGRIRMDGRKSVVIRVNFCCSQESLLNFCNNVGYRYCKEREDIAAYVGEYLKIKRYCKNLQHRYEKNKPSANTIKSREVYNYLRKHTGEVFLTTEIAETLSSLGVNQYDVSTAIYELAKKGSILRRSRGKPPSLVAMITGLDPLESAKLFALEKMDKKLMDDDSPERVPFDKWLAIVREGLKGDLLLWAKIAKKDLVQGITDVRDLVVEPYHSFIANGFVTHNCIYGISGCCRNRFGNVVAFEEINKRSRECMLRAKAAAESSGFHIVYSNVDSLFLSREGASGTDYEALAAEIAAETGMPMSLDKHFRFMAFLPLKGDPSSSALNHFFGLTYDGKVEARGIELRRSDTPEFVRSFQEGLIRSVLDHANVEDVLTEGVGRGMELLRSATERVRRGDVDPEELVIRRRLGKAVGAYTASVAQRSAALQLLHAGKGLEVGDDVPFIYTDHDNPNPLCRVRAPELFSGSYDREMYVRLLEEAASTVWRGMGAHPAGDARSTPTLERWIGRA